MTMIDNHIIDFEKICSEHPTNLRSFINDRNTCSPKLQTDDNVCVLFTWVGSKFGGTNMFENVLPNLS